MNKKKEKNVYASLKPEKITAPNKPAAQPKVRKLVGGDLRAERGKHVG